MDKLIFQRFEFRMSFQIDILYYSRSQEPPYPFGN